MKKRYISNDNMYIKDEPKTTRDPQAKWLYDIQDYWLEQSCVVCSKPGFQPLKSKVYCYDCYQKEYGNHYEMKATSEQLERYLSRHPNLRSKVTKRKVYEGKFKEV